MNRKNLVIFFVLISKLSMAQFNESVVYLKYKPWGPMIWKCEVPDSCPVEKSKDLVSIVFTGRQADYTYADTWYPGWASDDNMYSPYTDGVSGIWSLARSGQSEQSNTGQAKIIGDDPMNLEIISLGTYPGSAAPYGGRYPCGTLVHNNIWYYGTYCLKNEPKGYNWGTLGPFVGFRILFDRPTPNEHIISGRIKLSDGTTTYIGELPNSEYAAKEISFPAKEIEWMEFEVMGVGRAKNIGLAEIAVFR